MHVVCVEGGILLLFTPPSRHLSPTQLPVMSQTSVVDLELQPLDTADRWPHSQLDYASPDIRQDEERPPGDAANANQPAALSADRIEPLPLESSVPPPPPRDIHGVKWAFASM